MREDSVIHDEALVGIEAQRPLHGRHLVGAERRAVDLARVHQIRCGITDNALDRDERRPVGDGPGAVDRGQDVRYVLAAFDPLDVPSVRLVALRHVLGQRDRRVVLDRDLVVVIEDDEVAELLTAGDRRRLRGDALLDIAVGGDHVDVVVEGRGAGRCVRVEQAALPPRCHGHADRRREPLAQRPGGDLHTAGVPMLGVARRQRPPGPQRLEVGELQTVPGQVELDVEGQRGVPAGQHESVPADPIGIRRIVPHHALEQRIRQGSEAHRGSGVPVSDLLHGICGEHAYRVDGLRVQTRPVRGQVRCHKLAEFIVGSWCRRGSGHVGDPPSFVAEKDGDSGAGQRSRAGPIGPGPCTPTTCRA